MRTIDTGQAVIEFSKGRVIKKFTKETGIYSLRDRFENELGALTLIRGYPGVQQLIYADSRDFLICTEYAGEPLQEVPADAKEQGAGMLDVLKSRAMIHRDIQPKNIMVLDGRMTLIDFEWALYSGSQMIRKEPPPGLGLRWKAPNKFDDRYSMQEALGVKFED